MGKLRKIFIVVEENGEQNGNGFNLYMIGDTERIGEIKEKHMSAAEYWATRFFKLAMNDLSKNNVIETIEPANREVH